MKKLLVFAMSAVLLFTLSTCGSKNNANETASPEPAATAADATPAGTEAPAGEVIEVTIKAKKFEFDQADYKFKVGDQVKFILVNDDGMHGVGIADLGVNLNADNPESDVIMLDKAGAFDMKCTVMCGSGHSDMKSTITVE